jgi:hypothetical protein
MGGLFAGIERWQLLVAGALVGSGLILAVYEAVPVVQSWWSSLAWVLQ